MFAVRTNMLLVDAPHSRASLQKLLVHAVTLLELINASAAVNELLTAGIEGVALGADFDLELTAYGTALEGLTAGTANDAFAVGRMDVLFHFLSPNMLATGDGNPYAANSRPCNSIADAIAIITQFPEKKQAFFTFFINILRKDGINKGQ